MKSKQYAKKLLSLIIASVMIVTMLPVSALAAGVDDVMIEDQAETIVEEATDVSGEVVEEAAEVPDIEDSEDAAIVEGAVDEIAETDPEELTGYTETLSFTAQGVPSGFKMHFDAQLTGLSVSVVVPAKRAAKGSVMTADIVDVSAYEDAVAKKNYGKSIAGLYGLELHFYDKKGKEIKHINTSNITVTVDGFEASSYFIGRIDNKVKKIQRGTEPTFTFTEKKAYTYVIAGLEDDGLVRASGEADGDGNKRFNLNDENVNIEVVAPEDAFADGVAMEANDVTSGTELDAEDGDDALVGASADEIIAAYNISFYNEEGVEQQPAKAVTVTINMPLDMTKGYELIHIADDGTRSSVEGAVFTENGVTFTADSFSTYAVVGTGNPPVTLDNGDKYVIYIGTTAIRTNGTGTRPVTVSGNTVDSGDYTDIEWKLVVVNAETGRYRFQNDNGDYLGMKNKKNNYSLETTGAGDSSLWEYNVERHLLKNVGRNQFLRYNNGFSGAGTGGLVYLAKLKVPVITIHYVHEDGHEVSADVTLGNPASVLPSTIVNNGNAAIHDIVREFGGNITYHNTYIGNPREAGAVQIIPELKGVSGSWQYQKWGFETYYPFEDDTDIYVVYGDPYNTTSSQSTDPENPEIEKPSAGKYLNYNGDGTSTLSLSITATSASVDDVEGANVVMVFDISNSMTYSWNNVNNHSRLYWAQQAAEETVSTLLGMNQGKETPLVEMSLVTFNADAYRVTDKNGTQSSASTATAYWFTDAADLNGTETDLTDGVIGKLDTDTGTNWEKALRVAHQVADAKVSEEIAARTEGDKVGKADPTYVIFITDGEPSYYMDGDTAVEHTGHDPKLNESNDDTYYRCSPNYMRATDEARLIVQDGYCLYNVGIFGTLDVLGMLTNFAYDGRSVVGDLTDTGTAEETASRLHQDEYFYPSTDTAGMQNALRTIAKLISKSLNIAGVSFNDGVATDSAVTTLSSIVGGSVSGVSYMKTGGTSPSFTVKVGDDGIPMFKIGSNAPAAGTTKEGVHYTQLTTNNQGQVVETAKTDGKIYSYTAGGTEYKMAIASFENDNLHWDLSPLGPLEGGATYTISFVVWPKQEAYDYVANLNNGIEGYNWDESVESDTNHYNAKYGYYWGGVKDYPSIVKYTNGTFAVLTNTSQDVTYYIANEDEDGNVTYTAGEPVPLELPKPADLTSSKSKVEKKWNTELQMRQLVNFLYDGVNWDADGNIESIGTSKKVAIDFTVTKDNANYMDITLGWDDEQGKYVWADKEEDLVTIQGIQFGTLWDTEFTLAPGILLSDDLFKEREISAAEYPDTVTYTDPVTGEATLYHVLEPGHDYDVLEDETALAGQYQYEYEHYIYHPMLVNGTLYNASVERDSNNKITAINSMAVMRTGVRVFNTLRGGINLNKVVVDAEEKPYDTDDLFTFRIELENETEGTFVGNDIPWYAINNLYYHDAEWNLYNASKPAEGTFTLTDADGNTYEAASSDFNQTAGPADVTFTKGGEEVTIQLYGNVMEAKDKGTSAFAEIEINPSESLRVANVPIGTTFEITEVEMEGFDLAHIGVDIVLNDHEHTSYEDKDEDYPGTMDIDARYVTGEIVPNRENNVTFTNRTNDDAFYVYHSSDNTVEKIHFADSRIDPTYVPGDDGAVGTYQYEFNIVNETKSGHLYGGYFKAYKGAGMTDAQIIAATYKNTDSAGYAYVTKTETLDNWTTDSNGKVYDGATASQWLKKNAYKESGLAMSAEIDKVYYLKEIPKYYFGPAYYYVYDLNSGLNDLKKLYLMVPVDDGLYQFVCGRPIDIDQSTKLYGTFNVEKADGTKEPLTVKSCNSNLKRGYLTVWDGTKFIGEENKNKTYEWTPNFVTLDGVEVTSCVFRTINTGDLCHGTAETNFSCTDNIVPSTVKAYVPETSGD